MLVLTEAAAEVVRSITSTPHAPGVAGLRIVSSAPGLENLGSLLVSAAPGPGKNDRVIESGGAHVYLEPDAAAYLEDKVLDARVDNAGNTHFTLAIQAPAQV